MFGNHSFRKVEFILAVTLALIGTSASAWAQFRVFAKVVGNPTETTSPLIFDVNNDQTDNISPNIIINQDQQRGFVAYTGSGVIVEFSLSTGEILNRIPTGGAPCFATPLPNNRFAVVSVFENAANFVQGKRIFIIDMGATSGTSSLAATYTFANAQFGFGSILTLSPDQTVGYISSAGTGEVIKFSMADGRELGRIRAGMRIPAQITISPDGSTLLVVDVDPGTPELDFFDTSTFAKKGSLKNPDPVHDVVAFTIFNKAVLAPDGKTGIIASRGRNNVQFSELVFLFDATDGAILKTGNTGPAPGWTGLTPDGTKWVIINMFSVTVIPTDDFDQLQEFQANAGEPLGSANMVFSSDSKFGFYATTGASGVIHDQILQIDLETGSILEQLQVGDSPDTFVDQPSSMAITADGKILVALEFVSDNIDLMKPITLVAGGKFVSSPDTFTGISLLNLSSQTNTITVYAMQDFGEPNQETGVNNPVLITLDPNQQVSLTVAEIFNFDDSNAPNGERTGWLAIYSEQPGVTGYVTIGKKDLTSLNGLPLDSNPDRLHDWILPVVNRNGDASISLSTLNDTFYTASYSVARIAHDGTLIDSQPTQAASASNRVNQDLPDLFPRDHLDTEGYLHMTAPEGVFSNELYNNGTSVEILKGIDRYKHVGVTRLAAPQYATCPGWKTILNLINAAAAEADVTVTFHGADATVLWQFQKHFKIGEQLRDDVTNIFNNPPSDINNLVADPAFLNAAGWVEVESTQDQILGTLTFNASDDHFAASYELSATPLNQFIFPIVSQNDSYQTGVALLNNNADPANVTVELWGPDGNMIGTPATLTLAPHSLTAAYLDSLFPNMDPLLIGNLRIRSDKAVYGFGIVNDSNFMFVMAMPPIPFF